jgi:hypothetical protein
MRDSVGRWHLLAALAERGLTSRRSNPGRPRPSLLQLTRGTQRADTSCPKGERPAREARGVQPAKGPRSGQRPRPAQRGEVGSRSEPGEGIGS